MKFSTLFAFQFAIFLFFLKVSGEKVIYPSFDDGFSISDEMELGSNENEERRDDIAPIIPLQPVQWRQDERPYYEFRNRRNSQKSDERDWLSDEKYNSIV